MDLSDYQFDPDQFEIYTKILLITLWKGGYPHEIVCCMFNKCFNGWDHGMDQTTGSGDAGGSAWSPQKIVKELSDLPLEQSCARLEMEYVTFSALPENLVNDCFRILARQMFKRVEEIIKPMDREVRKRWEPILECVVGTTRLSDYFGNHPENNVSDWSYRVARRVKTALVRENWLEKPIEHLLNEIITS